MHRTGGLRSERLGMGPGLAFKPEHIIPLLMERPQVQWLELHLEHQLGGIYEYQLQKLGELYPLSMHVSKLPLDIWPLLDYAALRELRDTIHRYRVHTLSFELRCDDVSEQKVQTLASAFQMIQEIIGQHATIHPISSETVRFDGKLLMLVKELSLRSGAKVTFDAKALVDFMIRSKTSLGAITKLFSPQVVQALRICLRDRSALSHAPAMSACARLLGAYSGVPVLLDGTDAEYESRCITSCLAQVRALSNQRLPSPMAA